MDKPTQEMREVLRRLYGESIDPDTCSPDDLKRYLLALEDALSNKIVVIDNLLKRVSKHEFYLEKMIAVAQGRDE